MKMLQLDDELAGGFYAEHWERPFYRDLVGFMTSGPVVVQVLEGENAIAKNRELMEVRQIPESRRTERSALTSPKALTRMLSMVRTVLQARRA